MSIPDVDVRGLVGTILFYYLLNLFYISFIVSIHSNKEKKNNPKTVFQKSVTI